MKYLPSLATLDCPQRRSRLSFRIVDEHASGKAYAALGFKLHDAEGQTYSGQLDEDGYAEVPSAYSGPVVLQLTENYFGNELWYATISTREHFPLPLTALQIAAEQSPSGPRGPDGRTYLAEARARQENAVFHRVEVSDFADAKAHLPEPDATWGPRPSVMLKQNAGPAREQPGVALASNSHHVLEVKALRAYSPLFSQSKAFCALNAYHLAVMSTFAYAPFSKPREPGIAYTSSPPPYTRPGSIGHVLREQLAQLQKSQLFDSARYDLIYEEVPYSKRLEIMPYDPERYQDEALKGWRTPEDVHFLHDEQSNTQAFITQQRQGHAHFGARHA